MSRTRASAWTAATALLLSAVTMAVGFISTPYLVRWLGPDRFGAFRIVQDWLTYLTLLDLGLVGALVGCMSSAVGRGDSDEVRAWLSTGMKMYAGLMLIMLACGAVLVAALPSAIRSNVIPPDEIRTAGAILLVPVALIPLYVCRAVIELRQMGYLVNLLLIWQSVIATVTALVTAYYGWGLVGQSCAVVLSQLPASFLLTWKVTRLYPRFWQASLPAAERKQMWSLNWKTFIYRLMTQISVLSDALILGWLLGPVAVTSYLITQRFATILRSQIQSIGTSTWAGLLELHARGESERFREKFLEITGLTSSLALVLLGVLAAYNEPFLSRWVGREHYAGEAVNILTTLTFWFWCIFSIWHWPIGGTGRIGLWVPYAAVGTVLSLTIGILATWMWGVVGPLIGAAANFVTLTAWGLPKILHQEFGFSRSELWSRALSPLRVYLPYLTVVWVVARMARPDNYPFLALHLTAAYAAGGLLWWLVELTPANRNEWKCRLQFAFKREPVLA